MSVAFTREDSAETAAEIDLPDRPISPHPNLVTQAGLDQLTQALAEARALYDKASAIDDVNERRRAAAPAMRDAQYYMKRLKSAQLIPDPTDREIVSFGSRVTFLRGDGRTQAFRIVGEDEAEPRNGTISYVSPVGRGLHGKYIGDIAKVGEQELEIVAID